jgi:hypothetical protein
VDNFWKLLDNFFRQKRGSINAENLRKRTSTSRDAHILIYAWLVRLRWAELAERKEGTDGTTSGFVRLQPRAGSAERFISARRTLISKNGW